MGLLIVNADDLGGMIEATDPIAECFAAGAISSATFMVHMSDSLRAAEMARAEGWPVGLHLNLTQPFDAAEVPPATRERQRRACEYFERIWMRRRLPEPRRGVRRLIADAIAEQLGRFEELLQCRPTHLDSHEHVHTATAVLPALPRDLPLRRTASRRAALITRRFVTTDSFLGVADRSRAVDEARGRTVELMVHPSFPGEPDVLLSAEWAAQLQGTRLGSFADLSTEPRPASRSSF